MRIESFSPTISANTNAYPTDQPKSVEAAPKKQDPPQKIEAKVERLFTEEEVISSIEKANKELEARFTNLKFSIHERTREIMVKVIDQESGEVIREIPPEKVLDAVARLWELAGILVDKKA